MRSSRTCSLDRSVSGRDRNTRETSRRSSQHRSRYRMDQSIFGQSDAGSASLRTARSECRSSFFVHTPLLPLTSAGDMHASRVQTQLLSTGLCGPQEAPSVGSDLLLDPVEVPAVMADAWARPGGFKQVPRAELPPSSYGTVTFAVCRSSFWSVPSGLSPVLFELSDQAG
jgi:hypothetical protein